ncbi:unnamed protein product [Meloidogyne enterolobii]|uniref:Uncharacterized protein n=1 Tax=Meloidogyne enterolobii TaxID=390850 RepID=A0ACB1A9U9_MELEN
MGSVLLIDSTAEVEGNERLAVTLFFCFFLTGILDFLISLAVFILFVPFPFIFSFLFTGCRGVGGAGDTLSLGTFLFLAMEGKDGWYEDSERGGTIL